MYDRYKAVWDTELWIHESIFRFSIYVEAVTIYAEAVITNYLRYISRTSIHGFKWRDFDSRE